MTTSIGDFAGLANFICGGGHFDLEMTTPIEVVTARIPSWGGQISGYKLLDKPPPRDRKNKTNHRNLHSLARSVNLDEMHIEDAMRRVIAAPLCLVSCTLHVCIISDFLRGD